jgi:hypothetical protein
VARGPGLLAFRLDDDLVAMALGLGQGADLVVLVSLGQVMRSRLG